VLTLTDQQYDVDLRPGDTIRATVAEEVGGPQIEGMVTRVDEHGWYVDLTVHVGGRTARLRLYRQPEDRRHSPVIACRLMSRRDWRAIAKYSQHTS